MAYSKQSQKQKNLIFFIFPFKATEEKSRIRIEWNGSLDPDPYQNVTGPEQCYKLIENNYTSCGKKLSGRLIVCKIPALQLEMFLGQILS
jgi:hypothetical protein